MRQSRYRPELTFELVKAIPVQVPQRLERYLPAQPAIVSAIDDPHGPDAEHVANQETTVEQFLAESDGGVGLTIASRR
jgi:hypothetical protein